MWYCIGEHRERMEYYNVQKRFVEGEAVLSVTSQFSGISVIQFSPIKAQKKQPKKDEGWKVKPHTTHKN